MNLFGKPLTGTKGRCCPEGVEGMRYCSACKRFNLGYPKFCQYCGRSWGGRICLSCKEMNAVDAQFCGKCGKDTLSDVVPPTPLWAILLPWLLPLTVWVSLLFFFGPLILAIGIMVFGFLIGLWFFYLLLPIFVQKFLSGTFRLFTWALKSYQKMRERKEKS